MSAMGCDGGCGSCSEVESHCGFYFVFYTRFVLSLIARLASSSHEPPLYQGPSLAVRTRANSTHTSVYYPRGLGRIGIPAA
jgi:hypothetical protein